ncbi:MAG: ArsR family transcriptional regulator [Chloroflexi bacterium]|jgi:ArsR family transcriptional regulator|uniref:ArsR family transcriptional regulator n=1 Tax=Candidatus Thermofonsia Clade 3 bacterium TaxID=2364212 RepID=A0A2M8QEA5_9CHLR|nr:metalloregulator ArsR/SmtB family transcription factor [Candidatus Roseilinea sp. NK_OTU-006]PJF48137.1 MAG: ArsR family transcriptional regulator [Candidatus Thermofonsia Clade 3 bacterium]RMG62012.1 MAG: ArsR family transcriptional regulator [Chloroflexota bacterium]
MLNYSVAAQLETISLEWLAERLKVLAEPNRLRIFSLLMDGVRCNCELSEALAMPPNLISHHLSKLRSVGLVDAERDKSDPRWIYYSINRAALEALNAAFGSFFAPDRIQPRWLTVGHNTRSAAPSRRA